MGSRALLVLAVVAMAAFAVFAWLQTAPGGEGEVITSHRFFAVFVVSMVMVFVPSTRAQEDVDSEAALPGVEGGAPGHRPGDQGAAELEAQPPSADRLELVIRPDSKVCDGRFANNGWLQELPEAVTKMTWGNALTISPPTARLLGVTQNDVVTVVPEIDP